MITSEQISAKAARQVKRFLIAELRGEEFVPWLVPFKTPKESEMSFTQMDEWIRGLVRKSKEQIGYGYRIEFQSRRTFVNNQIPQRIIFDTSNDVYRSAGRLDEVDKARESFALLSQSYPVLTEWCFRNVSQLISSSSEFHNILNIVKEYLNNPRPDIYRREFAAAPHSKYLEEHERLLSEIFELVAPQHVLDGSIDFDLRYGFRKQPYTCWVRFLDPNYIPNGIPGDWIALPLHTLAKMNLPSKLLISENRTPLLSLPQYKNTLGVWGGGGAASLLAQQDWVNQREVFYWGDLDCHGLCIYGRFKEHSSSTRGVLMERTLLNEFHELVGKGVDSSPIPSDSLNAEELALHSYIASHNLRLEQERIPHRYVLGVLEALGFRVIR
ncbi:Wadjet anti-phage system protein JetD domain-containing protein [Cerasicoccus maritimus]|uniref:Wadjet anti-phage system protein JetD domain-containing protein n=1 Tax=Cerasicoccus maritimus TaxID=490089 RepID=UPI002852C681|nr:Wadjet anti-phage system protein JetD domain-containing protein [Cerasicoccus maritimus]